MTLIATQAGLPSTGGVAIPPEYHASVAVQLLALQVQARLVEDFPLPDSTEPAPVFRP